MPKLLLCPPPDPAVSVLDAHIRRNPPPTASQARQDRQYYSPWVFWKRCLLRRGFYTQTHTHTHAHTRTHARTRVPTGGPRSFGSSSFPCWRSDRPGPLFLALLFRAERGNRRQGQARLEGRKNSSLSDGNDTSCAVVAQETEPSSGWPAWAIVLTHDSPARAPGFRSLHASAPAAQPVAMYGHA